MGKNHFQFSLFLKDNTAEESHKSCMQLQFFVSLCISLGIAWHGSSIGSGGGPHRVLQGLPSNWEKNKKPSKTQQNVQYEL